MIPLFQREVVLRKQWMAGEEFIEMLALAQSSPGPIAFNTAVFVGYKARGWRGSLAAGIGIVLPSFLIILGLLHFLSDFKELPVVERVFKGIRPAVVALIVAPLWGLGRQADVRLQNLWLPVATVLLIAWAGISPVYVILATIALGLLTGALRFATLRKAKGEGRMAQGTGHRAQGERDAEREVGP